MKRSIYIWDLGSDGDETVADFQLVVSMAFLGLFAVLVLTAALHGVDQARARQPAGSFPL